MCLRENKNANQNQQTDQFLASSGQSENQGRFCVNNFKIVAATSVIGDL